MLLVNYFDHHIGDYDEATSHLTAREDGIYHRLIRKYYAKEKPLPADVEQLQRWVRCRDDEDRQAVISVLDEFFVLRDDGYHQKTCDEVLAAYHSGEPERETKRTNQSTRRKRFNEERSRLFQAVRGAGGNPRWDIGMVELRAMAASLLVAKPPGTTPGTTPGTLPRTPGTATSDDQGRTSDAPGTATQSQEPLPIEETRDKPPPSDEGRSDPPDGGSTPPAPVTTKALRGERLLKTWVLPRKWGEWALAKYPHWTAAIVLDIATAFRNHWSAKTGKDATKLDWEATWQNWCMSSITQKQYPAPISGVGGPLTFRQRDMVDKQRRIAQMTGGMANPDFLGDGPQQQEIIDVTAEEVHRVGLA